MRSNSSGGFAPGHVRLEPGLDPGAVDPLGRVGSLLRHERAAYDAGRASVDFGGVLTTPVWDSFAAFCETEGLDPDAIKNLFRTDPEALALLRGLETGDLNEDEFERKFGERLGLSTTRGLIDSMFAGHEAADPRWWTRCATCGRAACKTGLVSNSWSVDHYDRDLLAELFDDVVISAEVRMHKPEPEIYLLAAERLGGGPSRPVSSSTTCARTARAPRRSA